MHPRKWNINLKFFHFSFTWKFMITYKIRNVFYSTKILDGSPYRTLRIRVCIKDSSKGKRFFFLGKFVFDLAPISDSWRIEIWKRNLNFILNRWSSGWLPYTCNSFFFLSLFWNIGWFISNTWFAWCDDRKLMKYDFMKTMYLLY